MFQKFHAAGSCRQLPAKGAAGSLKISKILKGDFSFANISCLRNFHRTPSVGHHRGCLGCSIGITFIYLEPPVEAQTKM